MRICYITSQIPLPPSQTFIANEILGLQAPNLEISVFSSGGAVLRSLRGVDFSGLCSGSGSGTQGESGVICFLKGIASRAGLDSNPMLESAWVRGKAPVVDACVRHIKRFGVCHVHAQSAWLPAVFALAVGRLAQVSVSFSAHARDIFVGGTMFPAKLRQAGLCIVCTRAGADYLASVATPADRRKIQHVYHGTDLQMFSYNPPTEPNEPPCLLAVGRMVPKKGFDVLLAACALLKRRLAFRCVIVGSGPLHRTLRRHVGALELDDNVVFPGWQSYSAMPRQYRGADVLVVPSVQALDGDRDGLSNVVTESLACGTPVVASDFGGLPEAIRHEETGLLVPPGDPPALAAALERMLREPELRAHVAEQGRALAEDRFDSRSNVKRVRELLVETVELAK